MKVKQEIIKKLDVPENRMRLALAMGVGEMTIIRYIKKNEKDSNLTKVSALKEIAKILNVKQSEILTN